MKAAKKIFIDGFSGMAAGLFATLIFGTALCQIGVWVGGYWGQVLALIGNLLKTLTGAAIGVGIAAKFKADSLGTIGAAISGLIGACVGTSGFAVGNAGEPLAAFLAAVIAVELCGLIPRKTSFVFILVPLVAILTGSFVGVFIAKYITWVVYKFAGLANYHVSQSPIIGAMVVALIFGLLQTLPVNSMAIAVAMGLSGEAAAAALIGCCCHMVGYAVIGYRDNKAGGFIAQSLGSSKLSFPNALFHPLTLVPPVLSSIILAPFGTALLHMSCSAYGAGAGSLMLIGQFATVSAMVPGTNVFIVIIEIILMHFLLPGLLCLGISETMRKLGWIKKGSLKILP